MNALLREMRRSLAELDLGLRGDLTMSEPMERLLRALAADTVPARWATQLWANATPALASLAGTG
jgi:dynein heavy chain